jgi:hypothetical protein
MFFMLLLDVLTQWFKFKNSLWFFSQWFKLNRVDDGENCKMKMPVTEDDF